MTLLFLIMLGLDLEIPRFIWLDMGLFFSLEIQCHFPGHRSSASLVCYRTCKDQNMQNGLITGITAARHYLKAKRLHFNYIQAELTRSEICV